MVLTKMYHFYDVMFIDVHKDKSDNFELTDFAMEFLERNKIKKIKGAVPL